MGDIRYRTLTDEERDRLHTDHPHLRKNLCPTCEGAKVYRWGGITHDCDCVFQRALQKQYLWAGIGKTYQQLSWEDYHGDEQSLQQVADYVLNMDAYVKRGTGLYFTGGIGTGKTMLASLALKEMVKAGYRCFATTFTQVAEMFTSGWYDMAEKTYFKQRFIGSDVLLLDDVGRQHASKIRLPETTFDDILRTRAQHGHPTFLTSNLGPDQLMRSYGSASLRLIREKSVVIYLVGTDYSDRAREREQEEINAKEMRPIV